jgi:hypothetical protein
MPSSQELETKSMHERYKLETVQKFVTEGRLLEIGPSYGAFAYLAKKAGFSVEAIEMDAQCCRYLTEIVGVNAINTNHIDTALQNLMPYNVITLWHVIEHLPNPWETLAAISQKLLQNGILVIATPNPSALQFRIYGRYWVHVDAPRHLQLIPLQALIKYMESFGLYPVMATSTDKASIIFSTFGWWFASLKNLLKVKVPFLRAKWSVDSKPPINKLDHTKSRMLASLFSLFRRTSSIPIRFVKTFLVAILQLVFLLILKPIERRNGLGSAYTIVFKKK